MKKLSRLFAIAALCIGSSAFAADLPTSGTCGFTIGANFPLTGPFLGNLSGSEVVNHMGTINFGTKSISINAVNNKVESTTSTTTNGITSITGRTWTNAQRSNTLSFSTSASSAVSGMHVMALSNGDQINAIPVNNGKTVLMQFVVTGDTGGRVGVCQF
jgi:hypothetical protein